MLDKYAYGYCDATPCPQVTDPSVLLNWNRLSYELLRASPPKAKKFRPMKARNITNHKQSVKHPQVPIGDLGYTSSLWSNI